MGGVATENGASGNAPITINFLKHPAGYTRGVFSGKEIACCGM
jgi:hypothetical protein